LISRAEFNVRAIGNDGLHAMFGSPIRVVVLSNLHIAEGMGRKVFPSAEVEPRINVLIRNIENLNVLAYALFITV
jgi:hypothetical protein